MENIKDYLIFLLKIVKENINGHLPLNYRVQLMQRINNPLLINKIFYSCAVKVRQQYTNAFCKSEILDSILFDSKEFLYGKKGNKDDFRNLSDKYLNYLSEFGVSGWLLLSLCNNIATDAAFVLNIEEYDGNDDNTYDFEVWTPDFFAAMIFSGGNPFIDKKSDNIKKRKSFWIWYIGMVEEICKNPNMEITPFSYLKKEDKLATIPLRKQLQLDDESQASINTIIALVIKQIPTNIKWDKIEIYFISCLVNMFNISYSTGDKIELNRDISDKVCDILLDMRKMMYKSYPKEGIWFQVDLLINKDSSYNINFNYDEFDKMPELFQDPEWILGLVENFPRSKEYTPQWLQKIIGNKVKYLK